jgi:hypothetical protein
MIGANGATLFFLHSTDVSEHINQPLDMAGIVRGARSERPDPTLVLR